ncbi:MAG: SRPBCC domain-containing protein [bacterium]|nr:SRPBCC domain-containing protein [bacterium]
MKEATTIEGGLLTITRFFDAPSEKIWRAWTEPEQVKKWWGPKDFTAPSISIDLREGGKYLFCMRGKSSPEAPVQDFWSTGTYKEVVPAKKLVMTDSFADEKGNVVSSTHYGMEGFPMELEFSVIFEDVEGGRTLMTLRHKGLPEGMMGDLTAQGWNQSFDKLSDSLR